MAQPQPGPIAPRHAPRARRFHRARCRGSAVAYFLVILGLIVAGLVTTMSLASVNSAQIATLNTHRDAAFYAAEGGLERAMWELKNTNWSGRGYPQLGGTLGSAFYTAKPNFSGLFGQGVVISSTGASGVSPMSLVTVSATVAPQQGIPAVSVGGNLNANNGKGGGRLDIYGNVYFYGQALNRNVNNFNIHADDYGRGDFYFSNSLIATNHQTDKLDFDSGHTSHYTTDLPPKPNVPQMFNTLKANGCTTLGNRPSIINLDAALNHVVYIPSDEQITSSTTIIGDGIILVQNSLQISDGGALDGHHLCFISMQDISFDPGNHTTFSPDTALALYANTQVAIQSTTAINGVVAATQDFSSSGKITVTFDPSVIPLTDTRLATGTPSFPITVTAFTGPLQ